MNKCRSVAICVATFLRPKGLGELLDSLRVMQIKGLDVHLIIADNDAEGSGRSVVQERSQRFPFPVTYVVEPARGLASVRNRLFAEAYALNVEFIASIDDDATADPEWLVNLVGTAATYNADAVGGQVIFWIDYQLPGYILNVINQPKRETGSPTRRIGTGNALYRASATATIPGPFDPQFNFTGGEDSASSQEMLNRGFRLVSCGDAIVREYLPSSRATVRYRLTKSYANGGNEVRIALSGSSSLAGKTKLFLESFARFGLGSFQVAYSLAFAKARILRYGSRAAFGVGGMAAVISPRASIKPYDTVIAG